MIKEGIKNKEGKQGNGSYKEKNGDIDYIKFPPHVPCGQHLNQVIFWDNKNFVMEVQVEFIENIIKKWEY